MWFVFFSMKLCKYTRSLNDIQQAKVFNANVKTPG